MNLVRVSWFVIVGIVLRDRSQSPAAISQPGCQPSRLAACGQVPLGGKCPGYVIAQGSPGSNKSAAPWFTFYFRHAGEVGDGGSRAAAWDPPYKNASIDGGSGRGRPDRGPTRYTCHPGFSPIFGVIDHRAPCPAGRPMAIGASVFRESSSSSARPTGAGHQTPPATWGAMNYAERVRRQPCRGRRAPGPPYIHR